MTYIIKNVVYNNLYRFCIISLYAKHYNIALEMRLTFRSIEVLTEMCNYLDAYAKNKNAITIDELMTLYEYLRIGEEGSKTE